MHLASPSYAHHLPRTRACVECKQIMSASFSALSSPPPPSPTHLPLPGIGAAWHLAQVEVLQPVLQQMYVFPCDDWLQYDSKLGGLDNCKRELISGAAAAAGGLVSYKVSEGRAEDVAGGLALQGGWGGVGGEELGGRRGVGGGWGGLPPPVTAPLYHCSGPCQDE